MQPFRGVTVCLFVGLLFTSCTRSHGPNETQVPPYLVYVTNETSGDLSIIDPVKMEVITTVPLGKRPRGIHASPDRKTIYVALSGSPIAGPALMRANFRRLIRRLTALACLMSSRERCCG